MKKPAEDVIIFIKMCKDTQVNIANVAPFN